MTHLQHKSEYNGFIEKLVKDYPSVVEADPDMIASSVVKSVEYGITPDEGAVITFGTEEFSTISLCPMAVIEYTEQSEYQVFERVRGYVPDGAQWEDDPDIDRYAHHAFALDLEDEVDRQEANHGDDNA